MSDLTDANSALVNEVSLLNLQSQASFFNHLKSFMLNLITFVLKNT